MEEQTNKPCPHCGQILVLEDEYDRPELHCRCAGAMMEQGREQNTKKMMESLELLFGETCNEQEPTFQPVEEEIYDLLVQVVDMIGHEKIGAVSFGLRDGSSGKISIKGIERKRNITRKMG